MFNNEDKKKFGLLLKWRKMHVLERRQTDKKGLPETQILEQVKHKYIWSSVEQLHGKL